MPSSPLTDTSLTDTPRTDRHRCAPPASDLTAYHSVRDEFAAGMGRVFTIYGMNPLYGRILGALFLTPHPVSLGDVAEMSGMAKSTTSVALRQLEAFGLVRRSRRLRDRRDYYEAEMDGRAILTGFLRNYMDHELEEGRQMAARLKRAMADAGGVGWPDERALEVLRRRTAIVVEMTALGQVMLQQLRRVIRLSRSGHDLARGVRRLLGRSDRKNDVPAAGNNPERQTL